MVDTNPARKSLWNIPKSWTIGRKVGITSLLKIKKCQCVSETRDGWLCVAKLPPDYSDGEFQSLAAAYGKVQQAFLMISERTGESKGYGLIKYVSSDASAQARHLLDGREINSYTIDCNWLNSGHVSFKSLHSKCLYVNHLPADYRDMGEFRKIFAVIKNPPYCQVSH